MVTLTDRIFRAKLQIELEPTDFSIKRMMQPLPPYTKPQDIFVHLRTMQDRFWTEMAQAVSLIYEWAQYLRVPDSITDLKYRIWENFLCRLSLDARLITGKTSEESNGNEVLRIMIETVETTLLTRLSVHNLPSSSHTTMMPVTQQQQPPVMVDPLPTSLQAYYAQQQQQMPVDSKEMESLQRSMKHMALPSQGMPIKLIRRTDKDDRDVYQPKTHRKKKKEKERPSNKGSRSRKQQALANKYDANSSSSSGEEEKNDNNDEDDDEDQDDEEE